MISGEQAFDKFGNPIGREYDFGGGDEWRLQGERVLLYTVLTSEVQLLTGPHLPNALAQRNLHMDVVHHALSHQRLDERLLSGYSQLWFLSDNAPVLDDKQVDMIVRYVEAGNGLAIWADNEPFYADANRLASRLVGATFSGNEMGDQIMVPADTLSPGHFIDHPLTQGVNNLYEGITICTISPSRGVKLLAQSHDGQMCMGCFERDRTRVVLDAGFTKLYEDRFERTAGTARYLRNIAFWLARGSRDVEYTVFTPGRENLATISQGQLSQPYKYTLAQPGTLTYILTWSGAATLGLVVRDPQGRVMYDSAVGTSPLRVEIPTAVTGDWICQVRGVIAPSPNFPYVLTLALERGPAAGPQALAARQPSQPVTPPASSQYLPVYLIIDGSLLVGHHTAPLKAGLNHLLARLRARGQRGATAYLGMMIADESSGVSIPPTPPAQWAVPELHASGHNHLGSALRQVQATMPSFSAGGKPIILIMLGRAPEDDWREPADQLVAQTSRAEANVLVLGVGAFSDAGVFGHLTTGAAMVTPDLSQSDALQVFDWLYSIIDAGLVGIEAHVKRVQAPAPPPFLRRIN